MKEKKTSPHKRREAGDTLADLFLANGRKVKEVSEALSVDDRLVMEWICGRVPGTKDCINLSLILNCPLSKVYEAVIRTPGLL